MNTIKRAALFLTASVFVNVVLACGSDGLTFGGKGASAADGGGSAEATVVVATCDQHSDGKTYAEAIFGGHSAEDLIAVRVGITTENPTSPLFGGYAMRSATETYFDDQKVIAICNQGATATFVLP